MNTCHNLGTISPCQYDEGSPLVQKTGNGPEKIVVGIMSKNNGCADPSVPTIYTRFAAYSSWLLHFGGPQHGNSEKNYERLFL